MFFLLLLSQTHLVENSYFGIVSQSLWCVYDNKEYELRYDSRGKNPTPNKQTNPSQLQEISYRQLDQRMQTRMLHLMSKDEIVLRVETVIRIAHVENRYVSPEYKD